MDAYLLNDIAFHSQKPRPTCKKYEFNYHPNTFGIQSMDYELRIMN